MSAHGSYCGRRPAGIIYRPRSSDGDLYAWSIAQSLRGVGDDCARRYRTDDAGILNATQQMIEHSVRRLPWSTNTITLSTW